MKKHIVTLTTLATLMMGVSGLSHASAVPSVELKAAVVQTTCNITLDGNAGNTKVDFGDFLQSEMFAFTPGAPKKDAPIVMNVDPAGCRGVTVPAGKDVLLTADGSAALGSLGANSAFGDPTDNLGYGFDLAIADNTGASISKITPVAPTAVLAPGELSTPADVAAAINGTTITPELFSYAGAESGVKESSSVDSIITLKVAYN